MTRTDRSSSKPERRFQLSVLVLAGALFLSTITFIFGPSLAIAAEMKAISIPIQGMSCVSCVAKIKRTVKAIVGVSEVELSLNTASMRVVYDTATASPEQIAEAVRSLGYQAGAPSEAR